MPGKLYQLDTEAKKILELTWRGNFKNLEVKLNNKSFGIIKNKSELSEGRTFEIDYKTNLSVRLVKEMHLFQEIELLVNGRPVAGSMTHPEKRLKDVFTLIIILAAINIILGLLSMVTSVTFFRELGIGFWNIVYGGIFIMLGLMIRDKKSMFAMIAILIILFLDIIAVFLLSGEYPERLNPFGPVFVKVFFIIYLFRGIKAIRDFKRMEQEKELSEKIEEEKKKIIPLSEQETKDHTKFMPDDHSGYLPG